MKIPRKDQDRAAYAIDLHEIRVRRITCKFVPSSIKTKHKLLGLRLRSEELQSVVRIHLSRAVTTSIVAG